jgi:nitroreductase
MGQLSQSSEQKRVDEKMPCNKTESALSAVVHERRATRHFGPTPVRQEDLIKILNAGLAAPSGYNLQPWRFIVVRKKSQRALLRLAAMGQAKVEEAPVIIVACGDTEAWR